MDVKTFITLDPHSVRDEEKKCFYELDTWSRREQFRRRRLDHFRIPRIDRDRS
jgi:hypothetical protein